MEKRALVLAAAALAVVFGTGRPAAASGVQTLGQKLGKIFNNLTVFGLTDDGRLVRFRSNNPDRSRNIGYVTGLSGGDVTVIGIDFRVQDGSLYGVGNAGGVYTGSTRPLLRRPS